MIVSSGQKTKGSKINILIIAAWFLMIIGTLAQVTAIATSYWRGTGPEFHEGIFQRCEGGDCQSVTFFNGEGTEKSSSTTSEQFQPVKTLKSHTWRSEFLLN